MNLHGGCKQLQTIMYTKFTVWQFWYRDKEDGMGIFAEIISFYLIQNEKPARRRRTRRTYVQFPWKSVAHAPHYGSVINHYHDGSTLYEILWDHNTTHVFRRFTTDFQRSADGNTKSKCKSDDARDYCYSLCNHADAIEFGVLKSGQMWKN